MRKFGFLTMAVAGLMMFGACSDNNLDVGTGKDNPRIEAEDGVYFSVHIDLPSAGGYTRSETDEPNEGISTSNGGVEIGQDYENYVGDVVIVLAINPETPTAAVPTNGFIAAAQVPKKEITSVDSDKAAYQLLSSLTLTQLSIFYNGLPDNWTDYTCNVFVFANPGQSVKDIVFGSEERNIPAPQLLKNDWINGIVNLSEVPTKNIANKTGNGGDGSFLMSNATIEKREIPSTINDWRHFTTDKNPFDLSGDNHEVNIDNGTSNRGSIKLERAAARFDFCDGSPLRTEDGTNAFTYHVVKGDAGDGNAETPLIDIKLSNMSLVNVNKSFYALRRVGQFNSEGDLVTTLCGPERPWKENPTTGAYTGGNYVIDANQAWKISVAELFNDDSSETETPSEGPIRIEYSKHFFYPLFTSDGAINNADGAKYWYTSNCAEVIAGKQDNNESWNSDGKNRDYRIWTYATENTILGAERQKNGISTGVVFKGQMIPTEKALKSDYPDVKALANAIQPGNVNANSPFLFTFGGNIYLDWAGIRNAALNAAVSGIKWVPDSEEDPTEGKFEFTSIDRSNSLYVAVFGNDGGFGTVEFTYTEYNVDTKEPIRDDKGNVVQHKGTLIDTKSVDPTCADAMWKKYIDNKTPQSSAQANLAAFKKTATDAKITIYQPSNDNGDWGYYCYYYYWNRHNNNGKNGIMGPMEFAVVRNNVYKLAVTDIKQLGHPRLSENDPDRPTGGTDDETEDVYIAVTAEVLPWVVRVNDIEF